MIQCRTITSHVSASFSSRNQVNLDSEIEHPTGGEMNTSTPTKKLNKMELKPDLSPHRQHQKQKSNKPTNITINSGSGVRVKQKPNNSKPLVNVGSDWNDWGSSRKPVNVNHLLNFTFPERQHTFSNYQKRPVHGNFSKEKFVNAK